MFTDSSEIYDLVYSFKDYEKESAEIIDAIKAAKPYCKTILDIGCGTSEHHKYLSKHFAVDGIDLNESFVKISQHKNPTGQYTVADMANFNLNKQYDAVVCLFSSIGYLQTMQEIVAALTCFYKHLKPNGLLLVEPWFTKDTWHNGKLLMLPVDKENIKICRMTKSYTSGDFSILDFNYLVGTMKDGVKYYREEHKLRLTSTEEMLTAFKQACFDVTFDEKGLTGRGMYYGKNS